MIDPTISRLTSEIADKLYWNYEASATPFGAEDVTVERGQGLLFTIPGEGTFQVLISKDGDSQEES